MAPKRPSPTSKTRWAQRSRLPRTPARPKLSDSSLKWLSKQMQEQYGWKDEPRFFQLEGVKAQLEGTDMIIQAPTGAGKTAVAAGPYLWPGSQGKVTIMVCPLLALEDEMVTTFRDDFGLSAIAVNSVSGALTTEIVEELLSGKHQIILISPEMLQSPSFVNRVLRKPAFSRRVLSVVIDEAHCVSHWGADFRKKYGSLGVVRAFLPRGTPIIAVTATLTARVRRDLHRVLQFSRSGGSRFVNVGNDRPNVSIVVRSFEHPQNSFLDADFLIPPAADLSAPCDIPKTYFYVDDINVGTEIVDHLTALVAARCPALGALGLIRPFNATMSHEYRTESMSAFRSAPGTHSDFTKGCIRILVCTDAAGMGCNVKDVDRVVQWKLPKTLSSFVQRAGRAARSPTRTGLAILLVERAAYSVDLRRCAVNPTGGTDRSAVGKTTAMAKSMPFKGKPNWKSTPSTKFPSGPVPKDYAVQHGLNRGGRSSADDALDIPFEEQAFLDAEADDEGLRVFVQSSTCRRAVWATVFESSRAAPNASAPCCDICDPSLFDRSRPGIPSASTRKAKLRAKGRPDFDAQDRLDKWRDTVFLRDHSSSHLDASTILDDSTLTALTVVGPLTKDQVASILSHSWVWWARYGEEIANLIASLEIRYRALPKKTKAAAGKNGLVIAAQPPTRAPATSTPVPHQVAPATLAPPVPVQSASLPPMIIHSSQATMTPTPDPRKRPLYEHPASGSHDLSQLLTAAMEDVDTGPPAQKRARIAQHPQFANVGLPTGLVCSSPSGQGYMDESVPQYSSFSAYHHHAQAYSPVPAHQYSHRGHVHHQSPPNHSQSATPSESYPTYPDRIAQGSHHAPAMSPPTSAHRGVAITSHPASTVLPFGRTFSAPRRMSTPTLSEFGSGAPMSLQNTPASSYPAANGYYPPVHYHSNPPTPASSAAHPHSSVPYSGPATTQSPSTPTHSYGSSDYSSTYHGSPVHRWANQCPPAVPATPTPFLQPYPSSVQTYPATPLSALHYWSTAQASAPHSQASSSTAPHSTPHPHKHTSAGMPESWGWE